MNKVIKPLNKTLRKKIYLQAQENIQNNVGFGFLCGQFETLIKKAGIPINNMREVLPLLPEFKMFKPTTEEKLRYIGYRSTWFNREENGEQFERLTCLDLCLLLLND